MSFQLLTEPTTQPFRHHRGKRNKYLVSRLVGLQSSAEGLDGRVEEGVTEEVDGAGENDASVVSSLKSSNLIKTCRIKSQSQFLDNNDQQFLNVAAFCLIISSKNVENKVGLQNYRSYV